MKRKIALSWCRVNTRRVDRLSAAMSVEVISRRSVLEIAKFLDVTFDYCRSHSLDQDPYRYLFVDSLVQGFPDGLGEPLRLDVVTRENRRQGIHFLMALWDRCRLGGAIGSNWLYPMPTSNLNPPLP